jgi:hypothetical protein
MKKKMIFVISLGLISLHFPVSNAASHGVILQDYGQGDKHPVDFGIYIPQGGICNNAGSGSACTQNAMEVGPYWPSAGKAGFNKNGKDAFRFNYPYSYMHWYEVDKDHRDKNNNYIILRNCKAYFDTAFMIQGNSNIYFDGNCQVHIWTDSYTRNHMPVRIKCITSTGACCPGFTCNEPF